MSNLKIKSNLFLGLQELTHLKKSLRDRGYAGIFQNSIVAYGIVRRADDDNFESLQVYASSSNKLGVKAGHAIDSDLNIIELTADQPDLMTVASDSVRRYVVIKYESSVIEEGTVNIQADGSLIGTDTKFTERLRGLPDFPSKIAFESTSNTQEYIVQAVQSDTLASLNIPSSDITPENDVQYKVVGTFTPSITVPVGDKYPFENDSYVIELRDSNVLADNEYILAEVEYDGVTLDIYDKRQNSQFSLVDNSVEVITDENKVVGVEQIMYDSVRSTMHENLVKVGWGLESTDGNWAINAATQELTISTGSGGAWGGLAPFADGDFDNWHIVFESTGQVIQIQESTKVGTAILAKLDFADTYPTTGSISVTPNSDHVEITVLNTGSPTADKRLTFASISRYAIIPIQAGSESIFQYRHINRDQISLGRTVNDGSYIREPSFDESGFQVSQGVTNYFDGKITPLLSSNNMYDRITCNFIRIWAGLESEIPDGYYICNGENGTFDLRSRFLVGCDSSNTKFDTIGNTGGEEEVTLTVGQLPVHTHTGTVTGLDHKHDYNDHYYPESSLTQALGEGFGAQTLIGGVQGSNDTDEDNTILIYKEEETALSGDLSGTFTTDSTGNDEAHNNLPPYYTVCFIQRPCTTTTSNEVQGNILDLSTLQHFKNDAAAGVGGVLVGQFYLADKPNALGLAYGTVKRREA